MTRIQETIIINHRGCFPFQNLNSDDSALSINLIFFLDPFINRVFFTQNMIYYFSFIKLYFLPQAAS